MTDLHARILAVQLTHLCDSYEQDMGQCPCGFEFSTLSEWAAHVTDALLGELGLREETNYVYFMTEGFGGPLKPGNNRRYVTEWEPE